MDTLVSLSSAKMDSKEGTQAFPLGELSQTLCASLFVVSGSKFKWDDPIHKYLPSFPWPQVTIIQALTHHAGFAENDCQEALNQGWDRDDILYYFYTHSKGPLHPGSYHTNNILFLVLTEVLENIMGLNIEDLLKNFGKHIGLQKGIQFVPQDHSSLFQGKYVNRPGWANNALVDAVYMTGNDVLWWLTYMIKRYPHFLKTDKHGFGFGMVQDGRVLYRSSLHHMCENHLTIHRETKEIQLTLSKHVKKTPRTDPTVVRKRLALPSGTYNHSTWGQLTVKDENLIWNGQKGTFRASGYILLDDGSKLRFYHRIPQGIALEVDEELVLFEGPDPSK